MFHTEGVSPSEHETYLFLTYTSYAKIESVGWEGPSKAKLGKTSSAGGSLGSVCGDHFPHKKGCGVVATSVYNL